MAALFKTSGRFAPLLLRVLLAGAMFPHGAQKVLGWFGGYGFAATMKYFTEVQGIPAPFAFLAIAAEFLGPIGLLLGLLTRVAAFGIGIEMVVAAVMVHSSNGFFMNWAGNQKGEGFEYHILAIAIAVALMIEGAGKWSIDRVVYSRMTGRG